MSFQIQPATATAGGVVPTFTVRALDNMMMPVMNVAVTVSVGSGPGAISAGTVVRLTDGAGTATFNDIRLNTSGTYQLLASAMGFSSAVSNAFVVNPSTPFSISIVQQPGNAVAGASIAPSIIVRVKDQFTNDVADGTSVVASIAVGFNPGSGTLTGTTTRLVSGGAGQVAFDDLKIDKVGSGYALRLTAAMSAFVNTSTFNLTPAAAVSLSFTAQPMSAIAGASLGTAQVTAFDAFANVATASTVSVSLAIGTNPGGGTLAGAAAAATVSGVATFSGLSIDKSGNGYTLTAAATGLIGATSNTFNISSAAPSKVVFVQQPSSAVAGVSIAPAVTVQVRDAFDNLVTTASNTVNIAIQNNAGPGGSLSGTTGVVAASGVATFNSLSIDRVGAGYSLAATANLLSGDVSSTFNITAAAANKVKFTIPPSNTVAGATMSPAVQVTVQDQFGNTVTSANNIITLAIGTNPPGTAQLNNGAVVQANASGGVAVFNNLFINTVANGYTLTATSTGLTSDTSSTFNISPDVPFSVAFGQQPSNVASGSSIAPAVTVRVLDRFGNIATSATNSIVISLGPGAGSAVLSGTTTVSASAGVATFSNLAVNLVGANYTLVATSSSLSAATSSTFNVTPGAAATVAFGVGPSATVAGATMTPSVTVNVLDANGNRVTTASNMVALALASPGGATLTGGTAVAAVSGVATFGGLSVDKTGSYNLVATSTGLSAATSGAFTIAPGAAAKIVFAVQPSNVASGAVISPSVQVSVLDTNDNLVTGAANTVTLALATAPSGGILGGTTSVAAAGGIATFSTLNLNRVGNYSLSASATGITGAIASNTFAVSPGAASQLAFTTQPTNGAAGATLSTVQVTVQDANGNTVTASTQVIVLAFGANPGSATLLGTTSANASNGVASFSNLQINTAATGYTLTATAPGALLTGATSAAFNILPNTANRLLFLQGPSTVTAATIMVPSVQVVVQDSNGNTVTTATSPVTVALGANPGGSTLGGTLTITPTNGIAVFSDLTLNRVGTNYTMIATATGLISASGGAFNVNAGAAVSLAVITQPTGTQAALPITPPVQIGIFDSVGNLVTSATNSLTVVLGANPGGGTLSGTATVSATGGIASFSNLSLNRSGLGYTLVVSGAGLGTVTTNSFNVTPGAATQLGFLVQPTTATAGQAMLPAVQVAVQDANGNTVTTATNSITIAIGANPGQSTLSGTTTVSATSGVASFSGLMLNKAATGYTFTASATALTSVSSNAFLIVPGLPTKLAYIAPTPSLPNINAGAQLAPALQIAVTDDNGNTVTTATDTITLAIKNNAAPGLPGQGGVLSGTTSLIASNGIATFSTLTIDKAGTGYTLEATAPGRTAVTTPAFNIVAGNATRLGFVVQPVGGAAGATLAAVQVTVQDQLGNTVTTATNNITIAMGSNPGGGTLGGTATITAVNGVATFSNLSIDKAGNGYTLIGSASGLTSGTSQAFNMTAGGATQLGFVAQPANTVAGLTIAPAVQVAVQDANGNTVTSSTASITIAIGVNPGNGTLRGTLTVTAVNGVATFNDLSIDKIGSGYVLRANSTGLTGANSSAFNVTVGAATRLGFIVQPSNANAGVAIAPAVQVAIQDAQGNTIAGATNSVSIVLGTNPSGATLSGTLTVAAVNGVATFSGASVNLTGTGYAITATSSNLTNATSSTFNVLSGAAAKLGLIVQPSNTVRNATITPAVQVAVQDAGGNTVTTATNNITIALGTNPASGTLSGTLTAAAVNGIATFGTLRIDRAGNNYTLLATSTSLTGANSSAFNITAAAPTVTAVSPATGVNNTSVSLALTGTGFVGGATGRLTKSGQADIAGTNVVVVSDTSATASFNLNGAATGAWNLVLTNLDGQFGQLDNGFTISAPTGALVMIGLAGSAVSLVSLPDIPSSFDPFAGFIDRNRNSLLARWNPLKVNDATFAKYEFLIDGGTTAGFNFAGVETARGYWRKASAVFTGNFVSRTTTFDLNVLAGSQPFANWNLIGVPYTSGVELSSLSLITNNAQRTYAEAVQSGIVSDFVWTFPVYDNTRVTSQGYQLVSTTFPNAVTKLESGRGYWFAVTQDSTIRFNPPTASSQRPLASARPSALALSSGRRATLGDGWITQLRARVGDFSDDYNYFGVGSSPRALLEPPRAPEGGYVTLTFVEGSATSGARHASSIHNSPARARNEWEFTVETNQTGEVELSWPDLGSAPKELAVYLTDVESGRRVYMRTQSGYVFRAGNTGPRRFRISAEPRNQGNLLVRDMSVLRSGANGSTVTFTLSQNAEVEARLISPSGKVISQQQRLNSRTGLNSITIRHQDARGFALPRGVYLVEVTATAAEGQTVRALKSLVTK